LEAWCSGLTCGPVKAEIAGSNPVASALTKKVDNLKLYERQEIVDPLYYSPACAHSLNITSRFGSVPTRLPVEQWEIVTKRHLEGESLRQLAKVYGVSHEAVRQIVKRVVADTQNIEQSQSIC
jgi:DNA-directed RNA polymerase sigma subunit (sigma70/sigma32)